MREIHNKKETIRAKLLLGQIPFTLVLATGILALFQWIAYGWLVAAAGLFVITLATSIILQLNFVRINEYADRWEIRFYSISPFGPNYRMISIEKKNLIRAELLTHWRGLRKILIVEELINGERAVYPPISLSLHTKAAATEIIRCLTP